MKTSNKVKIEKWQQILKKYGVGEIVDNQDDIRFLLSIFQYHTEWELKQGVGVASISIALNKFNTNHFQLNRIDGSFTDISFRHSIESRSKPAQIKMACRSAIRRLIEKFRIENVVYGETICPFTGETLTKDNTHIDHYDLTFADMYNRWVANYDLDYLFSKINATDDNSVLTCFTDKSIIDSFIDFHNNHSKLRAVSKLANLTMLRKQLTTWTS